MQTKARALVVMSKSSFEAHFDRDRLRRLAGLRDPGRALLDRRP